MSFKARKDFAEATLKVALRRRCGIDLIVNDDFDLALSDLKTIIRAERLRLGRQLLRHDALISKLLAD
jgi:guanylate kinase